LNAKKRRDVPDCKWSVGLLVCWFLDEAKYNELLERAIDICSETEKKAAIAAPDEEHSQASSENPQSKTIFTTDIEAFIEKQKDFRHSHESLSRHFYGRSIRFDPKDPNERSLYDTIWRKAKKARISLAKKNKGNWIRNQLVENGIGQPVQYMFIRSDKRNSAGTR